MERRGSGRQDVTVHELSIALSVIDVASAEAERQGGGRVVALHLRLGALAGVIPDALRSAWELACEGTPLAGCRLLIQDVPITVDCEACGAERPARSVQEICCAQCGAPAARVLAGREMEVVAIELLDSSSPP